MPPPKLPPKLTSKQTPKDTTILILARLDQHEPTTFDLAPDAQARNAIARRLGFVELRKLRLTGRLIPDGAQDWRLTARLGATIVQECVATLDPVTTRLDEDIERRYVAHMPGDSGEPDDDEGDEDGTEIVTDDRLEPLNPAIDLGELLEESLALTAPQYPRVTRSDQISAQAAPPGVTPLRDEDTRPFAALAALKDKMGDKD